MAVPESDLTFIVIETQDDIPKFLQWLDRQKKFPFSFYLCGITYTMKDEWWRNLFMTGFDAAHDSLKALYERNPEME